MRVLAIDTTGAFGSLALLDNGALLEEVPLHAPDGFAHVLYPQLEALLARRGVALDSIDLFAAAAGPGSFTGVRVGLAAVKGLAEGLGRKAAAVSNLRALASFGSAPLRAPFLDARRGEIYGAVYDANLTLVQEEIVAAFPAWRAALPDGVELLTQDPALFPVEQCTPAPRALAAAVARVAARDGGVDPVALDANYVRRSDAELHWRE
jgi:tRNA threonylcarbamoyladenosine biosynthesis protein TsaB